MAAGTPFLKCNAKGTSCICSIYLAFLFFSFLCSYEAYLHGIPPATADPPMGIITVSCKGSVLLRNMQSAVLSLIFPDLCVFSHFFKGN